MTDHNDESGWVIERGDSSPGSPTYWSGPDAWSQDHMDAVRFARKQDAERVACRVHGGHHRVCEHLWCGPEAVQCDACGEMVARDDIAKVTAYGIETSACAKCRGVSNP